MFTHSQIVLRYLCNKNVSHYSFLVPHALVLAMIYLFTLFGTFEIPSPCAGYELILLWLYLTRNNLKLFIKYTD